VEARSARVWAAIAAAARREGDAVSLRHAVTACADALAAAGVGLSVNRNHVPREPVLASAPAAEELEELQFTLGQGPCVDAAAGHGPVLVPDLSQPGSRGRWPQFAPAAAERGVRGLFAFPVAAGAAQVGVLGVYRLQAGPLNADELADGLLFADTLLMLALDERSGIVAAGAGGEVIAAATGLPAPDLTALRRAGVHQATGMAAAQLRVGMPDALAALRARAYVTGQRLSDVAADVLARRIRFAAAGPQAPPGPAQSSPATGEEGEE
jgi:hypothetical protein